MAEQKYTTEQMIKAIKDKKGIVSSVADTLGCSRNTVMNYVARYATVHQALQDERERMVDTAESALYVALANKEPWAISLTLKTLGKNRGYVERQEQKVSGDKDEPLRIEVKAIDYRIAVAGLAPRSVGDSATSSEDESA